MLIGVIGWIVLGLITGFIGSKLVKLNGDDPNLGILVCGVGGLMGGWLYSAVSGVAVSNFNPRSLMFAAIAAVVVLIGWHRWRRASVS